MIRPYGRNQFGNFVDFYNGFNRNYDEEFVSRSPFKMDVIESEKEYKIEAELPGFEKSDIQITMDEGKLTLKAEKSEEFVDKKDEETEANEVNEVNETREEPTEKYIHRERRYKKLARTLYFKDVNEDELKASLDKGILTIIVPKKEISKTKKNIEIA